MRPVNRVKVTPVGNAVQLEQWFEDGDNKDFVETTELTPEARDELENGLADCRAAQEAA